MRDLTITLALAVVLVSFCSAQSFENQKMLTTTLHAFTSNSFETDNQIGFGRVHTVETSSFSFRPQITYGRVNSRNVLFAYGVELEYSSDIVKTSNETTSSEVGFGASPVIVSKNSSSSLKFFT